MADDAGTKREFIYTTDGRKFELTDIIHGRRIAEECVFKADPQETTIITDKRVNPVVDDWMYLDGWFKVVSEKDIPHD